MTLPLNDRVTSTYTADGTNKEFNFDFRVFFNVDSGSYGLEVRKVIDGGYEVISPSDYTVVPNEGLTAGKIVFAAAPVAGTEIYLAGKTPTIQQLNLTNYGRFSAEAIETNFDFITAIIQEFISSLDIEISNRILADQALKDYVVSKFTQLATDLNTRFENGWAEINNYISTVVPVFACIMKREINNYIETDFIEYLDGYVDANINNILENSLGIMVNHIAMPFVEGKTYALNQRVMLENGDIVKSTIPNNTVNPDIDMTGWVLVNSDSQIKTWSGRTQEEKNKEIASILDFGASNSLISSRFTTIEQAQSAYPTIASSITSLSMTFNDIAFLLYKAWLGGSGEIKIPSGIYNFNVTQDFTNYRLKCDSDVIIDLTDNVNSYGFRAAGTLAGEINVTSVNVSTRILAVADATSYNIGDWCLLKSVVRCDTPDAGDKWQLGSGTAGASPVYFAEPVQIQDVGINVVTVTRGFIFPHYSKTVEGKVATLAKIGFSKSEVLGFPEIILPNKYFVTVESRYAKDSRYEFNYDTTVSSGSGLLLMFGMANNVKGTASRPPNWELNGEDHSKFNTWKTISGWYNEFDVTEYNGSQSVDRSYSGIPSIGERFRVRSINPKEQGITTHGMGYGTYIDATVSNNITSAVSNRDRFATIKLTAIGNGEVTNQNAIGLSLLDFGMTDIDVEVNIINQYTAIKFDKSYGAVPYTPETLSGQITGQISQCRTAYLFERKVPAVLSQESRFSLKANTSECRSIVYSVTEDGWDNFTLEGNHQVSALASLNRAVFLRDNSFGWIIRNFVASGYPSTMTCIHIPTGSTTNKLGNIIIDWNSCKFLGAGYATTQAFNSSKQTTVLSAFFTDKYQLENFSNVRLVTNTVANRVLTLNPADAVIPYNKEFTIYCDNLAVSITNGGVTVIGTILADAKVVKLIRMGGNTYIVSSSN